MDEKNREPGMGDGPRFGGCLHFRLPIICWFLLDRLIFFYVDPHFFTSTLKAFSEMPSPFTLNPRIPPATEYIFIKTPMELGFSHHLIHSSADGLIRIYIGIDICLCHRHIDQMIGKVQ